MQAKDRISRRVIFRNKFFIAGGLLLFLATCILAYRLRLFSEFEFGGRRALGWVVGPLVFLAPVVFLRSFNANFARYEANGPVSHMAGAAKLLAWPILFGPAVILILLAAGWKYYYIGMFFPTTMKQIFLHLPLLPALAILLLPIARQWFDIQNTLNKEVPYLKQRISTPPKKVAKLSVFLEFGAAFVFIGAAILMIDIEGRKNLEEKRVQYCQKSMRDLSTGLQSYLRNRHAQLRGRGTEAELFPDRLSDFKPELRQPVIYVDPETGTLAEFLYAKPVSGVSQPASAIVLCTPMPYKNQRIVLRYDLTVELRNEEDIPASFQK